MQSWLEAKGFQEDVRKKLRGTSGAELFKLEKAEFQAYAGEQEGWRLYSQLTVQRNVSGVILSLWTISNHASVYLKGSFMILLMDILHSYENLVGEKQPFQFLSGIFLLEKWLVQFLCWKSTYSSLYAGKVPIPVFMLKKYLFQF